MEKFLGINMVGAFEMSRKDYNIYRDWELPKDENGDDKGYLVELFNIRESNHPDHDEYISWLPKEVFEKMYRKAEGMSFGLAIEAMKLGKSVCRTGWNGKGMYIYLDKIMQLDKEPICPFISMHNAQSECQPGWLASQADILAEDWIILN